MAARKIINDRQRARKVYGFVQRLPDKISLAELSAESDASVLELDWKESVKMASTANIVNFGVSAVVTSLDGVSITYLDRVLIKDQSTLSENGIYIINSSINPSDTSTWVRTDDAVPNSTLTKGATVYIEEGTANAQKRYIMTNITVGGDQTWTLDAGSPPGSDTQIIFNDGGAYGANASFTFNKTTSTLSVGPIIPIADAVHNLGSPSARWANVYTGDLHLRNDKGDWTLIEDEEALLLRNNKTDKFYKFVIEPVNDPENP